MWAVKGRTNAFGQLLERVGTALLGQECSLLEISAKVAAEIATGLAEVAPRALVCLFILRLHARFVLAEISPGVEELLSDHAADEASHQAAEDRAGHHTAHARTTEGTFRRSRLAHLGPRRQPRQGLRIVTAPGQRCAFLLWCLRRQLTQRLRSLSRSQLGERLFVGLLDRLGRRGLNIYR